METIRRFRGDPSRMGCDATVGDRCMDDKGAVWVKCGAALTAWIPATQAYGWQPPPPGAAGASKAGPKGDKGDPGPKGDKGDPGDPGDAPAPAGWVPPIDFIWPSMSPTNPATHFPGTTWVAVGAGACLVGFANGDSDFGTPGATVGAKTATPTGSVSAPTFTGQTSQGTSAITAGTPAGTNSAPTFTGTSNQNTSAITAGTPAGTNSAPAFTGTASQPTSAITAGTPAGTNSAPTFTGSALGNHAHELPFQKVSGATGVLRMLAASVFGTGTSRAAESQSAAPVSNTTSAAVELSQAVSAGTPAGSVSAPVFTGSALATHQHTLTPAGTVAAPTFTGSALATHQHTLTPAGTISAPAFTGSALGTHAHTITPAGSVSAPTFTGAALSVIQPSLVVYFFRRTA